LSGELTIVWIALGLAMDAFSVAVGVGCVLPALTPRRIFRLSFHFGFFQFMMPVLGWAVASGVSDLVKSVDHWLGFGLLAFIGGKMLYEGIRGETAEEEALKDPTKGISLVTLSVATSIDAFAVGLTLGLMKGGVWGPSVIIGLVAAAMTIAGMLLGRYVGHRTGRAAEIIGGLVLIGIGVKLLIEQLAGP
jgi:putative Mn2+ efflux pump MntP